MNTKQSDRQLIDKSFYGERANTALKVFRAIKRAGRPCEEELAEKMRMTEEEVVDMTDSLRCAGFIVSSYGRHQVSRAYNEGEL